MLSALKLLIILRKNLNKTSSRLSMLLKSCVGDFPWGRLIYLVRSLGVSSEQDESIHFLIISK